MTGGTTKIRTLENELSGTALVASLAGCHHGRPRMCPPPFQRTAAKLQLPHLEPYGGVSISSESGGWSEPEAGALAGLCSRCRLGVGKDRRPWVQMPAWSPTGERLLETALAVRPGDRRERGGWQELGECPVELGFRLLRRGPFPVVCAGEWKFWKLETGAIGTNCLSVKEEVLWGPRRQEEQAERRKQCPLPVYRPRKAGPNGKPTGGWNRPRVPAQGMEWEGDERLESRETPTRQRAGLRTALGRSSPPARIRGRRKTQVMESQFAVNFSRTFRFCIVRHCRPSSPEIPHGKHLIHWEIILIVI